MRIPERQVGKRLEASEAGRLVRGSGRFLDDLPFPGSLHVAILRSEMPHALVERVDSAEAAARPGVLCVLTYGDLRRLAGPYPLVDWELGEVKIPPSFPLADGEVRFRGEPIAAVVAETPSAAADALELVRVEYRALPAVLDPAEALGPGAPRAHAALEDNVAFRWGVASGDVEAAFEKADRVFSYRFVFPRETDASLEPRGVVASFLPGRDELTVWATTRIPHVLRVQLARALRLPEGSVRVIAPEVGGLSHSRFVPHAEEALLGALARMFAPRPVKWVEGRAESLTSTLEAVGQIVEVGLAARRDGRILALRSAATIDLGAHHTALPPFAPPAVGGLPRGPYEIPAARLDLIGVFTNRPPTSALWGRGAGQIACAIEMAIDRMAAGLELEPVELRRIHLARPPAAGTPAGSAWDGGDPGEVLDAALELARIGLLREEREMRRAKGELVGIGAACLSEPCSDAPSKVAGRPSWESATVRVFPSGKVEVLTSVCPCGPGLETAMRQIAADALRVAPGEVRVSWGDTAASPPGAGAPAGRSVAVGGSAVGEAAHVVAAKMRRIAAAMLGVAEDYVEPLGDAFAIEDASVKLADVAYQAHQASSLPPGEEPGLEATRSFDPDDARLAGGTSRVFGAHVCLACVDPETGEARIEKHFSSHDLGTVIHPASAEARIRANVLRGLAVAFREGREPVDEGGPGCRALARPGRAPDVAVRLLHTPARSNPLGARGAGDVGLAGAVAAAVNAVRDALAGAHLPPEAKAPAGSAVGPGPANPVDLPLLPERIWRCLTAPEAGGGPE